MGSLILILMVSATILMWVYAEGSSYSDNQQSRDSLDSFIYHHSLKKLSPHPRTSRLYNIDLPANFSGIGVSFIRLRSSTLWRKGANHNSCHIPKRTLVWPFTRRVDLVYQNLGNLSSFYYHVPGHTIISPVLGLLTYNNSEPVELNIPGNDHDHDDEDDEEHHILIQFPLASSGKCVRFDSNGELEFFKVDNQSRCIVRKQGHFCIVKRNKGSRTEKRKVIGIVVGVVGILMVFVMGFLLLRKFEWKKVEKMESQSERSESLGTTWVGNSRMPSATAIRTQPVIEDNYAP